MLVVARPLWTPSIAKLHRAQSGPYQTLSSFEKALVELKGMEDGMLTTDTAFRSRGQTLLLKCERA